LLAAVVLALAACGSSQPSSQPRTQVFRSANPLTSDIYLRITGPGGAISYVAQRFEGAAFRKYDFSKVRRGVFLPPQILVRKLCSSTHTIRRSDAQALQEWRGKLAITVYAKKNSAIFCAAFGPGLYQQAS
jgi:hypothetical protein